MAQLNVRRPLAAAAVLASALGGVAGLAGQAGATTYGDHPGSPVTITSGSTVHIVGGSSVQLPAGAHDVSWAGQGGRLAFIGGDDIIYTADFDGSHIVPIAHGNQPSHTVWDSFSTGVYWTEGTGSTATIVGTSSNGSHFNLRDQNGVLRETFDGIPSNTVGLPTGLGFSNLDVAADRNDTFVFQTTDGAGNTGVATLSWVNNTPTYTTVVAPGTPLTGGSTPTISANGEYIAFVRQDGAGAKQLFASQNTGSGWSTPVAVTALAGDHTDPIFEADTGSTNVQAVVAFDYAPGASDTTNAAGVYQVAVPAAIAASGPVGGSETSISTQTGALAVRTDSKTLVERFAGGDRFDTAVRASRAAWANVGANGPQAQAVVLSRSDNFADALGGAALAAHRGGPLLLTATNSLNPETHGEIERVLAPGGTIFVLGGKGAIGDPVVAQLEAEHYNVVRIGGADRYTTAVLIANAVDPNPTDVIVATGMNYPDALSAGAVAASYDGTVVVLSDDGIMPDVTNQYIADRVNSGNLRYLGAVGGSAAKALSDNWTNTDSIVGASRYDTSLQVAQRLFGAFPAVGVATGGNWPDSLAGGALMGHVFGPLLLADPTAGLTPSAEAFLDANRGAANLGYVFGGQGALTPHVDDQLGNDLRTAEGFIHAAVAKPDTKAFPLTTPDVKQR